jgi:phosphatidylglycerophosphate synthase/CTP:molybdopterin cytidylyltransferase MocA
MLRIPSKAQLPLRLIAIAMSAGFFYYLIWRTGPSKLWKSLSELGWGIILVIALAGVSHLARTWGWRLTLGDDRHKISFSRMVGLRLGAEAAGQLGILGQTLGDSVRVSRMSAEIPVASGLASVTLDRGLYVVTGIVTTIAGILAALPLVALPHALRLYASLFVFGLVAFLMLTLFAVRKRWPVLSRGFHIIGRVPSFKNWMENRYLLVQSVENALFDFHHKTPGAFWASFSLNLAAQCLAVSEVCLILWLMGVKMGFFSALVIEALTKLVNVVGNFNPGNFGTYEGGTMLIGKMFGLSSATGLALGLSRRLRSFFWAAVGAICFVLLTRPSKHRGSKIVVSAAPTIATPPGAQASSSTNRSSTNEIVFAIFLADGEAQGSQFNAPLTRVGTLPILLRTILAAQKAGSTRIIVVADPITKRRVQRALFFTGRLPECVEWIEAAAGASLSQRLLLIVNKAHSERLVLIDGNRTYHPSLLRKAAEWNNERSALALASDDELAGIFALPVEMIRDFAERCPTQAGTLKELHASLTEMHSVVSMPVADDQWQRVNTPEDCEAAERKLDRWLVKSTDGFYARLNRRISIPISRQLIKFPITPNMVSLFTLGVGIASAGFFAFGGYWSTLLGAFLCLFASILDGSDGEVARLKLQESDFGCWLETMCDYAFYLFLLAGMTIGQWRSSGTTTYLVYAGLLLFGALASFLALGWERRRLAAGRPEQLLKIWQTHAESRPSNPFLYFGRRLEFIVRRCFFPYALLVFALFNLMNVAFILSVIGANLVWPIALYSSRTFARPRSLAAENRTASSHNAPPSREYAAGLL